VISPRKNLRSLRSSPALPQAILNLAVVRQASQAAAMLDHPIRLRLLLALCEPNSSSGLARDFPGKL
jgi:hypothetical protein